MWQPQSWETFYTFWEHQTVTFCPVLIWRMHTTASHWQKNPEYCGIIPYYGSPPYRYNVLPMGLSISSAKWMEYVNLLFDKIHKKDKFLAIMHDVLIHSSMKDHWVCLENLFNNFVIISGQGTDKDIEESEEKTWVSLFLVLSCWPCLHEFYMSKNLCICTSNEHFDAWVFALYCWATEEHVSKQL